MKKIIKLTGKKIIKLTGFTIFMFYFMINFVKAQIIEMDPSLYTNLEEKYFKINLSTFKDVDINSDKIALNTENKNNIPGKIFTYENNCETVLNAEKKDNNKNYLLRLNFENVDSINGRQVDLILFVNDLKYTEPAITCKTTKPSFLGIREDLLWIGSATYSPNSSIYIQNSVLEIELKANIIWHDNKEIINLPFLSVESDIDSPHEAWKPLDGYTNDFYIYNGSTEQTKNRLVYNDSWTSTMPTKQVDGKNSYTLAGVFAPTTSGSFTSKYYESICATSLLIGNQFNLNDSIIPSKTSFVIDSNNNKNEKIKDVGDKLTYTISYNLGEKYKNIFTPYHYLYFEDGMPKGLKYESSSIKIKNGDEIIKLNNENNYGVLSYDSTSNKIVFNYNNSLFSNIDNYKNIDFIITINATVEKLYDKYINIATLEVDNLKLKSNEVVNYLEEKKDTQNNPKTFDNIIKYFAIGIVSVLVIFLIVLKKVKIKKK